MIIAIVGSRKFADLTTVVEYVNNLPDGTVIISGGANGPDKVAEETAINRGLEVVIYKPDWKTFGRSAGPRRNYQIVENADRVVAFWDRKSLGTASTIRFASEAGKPVEIIYPDRYRK